jgi:hypothetical protein
MFGTMYRRKNIQTDGRCTESKPGDVVRGKVREHAIPPFHNDTSVAAPRRKPNER